jgi:hypothetical protein
MSGSSSSSPTSLPHEAVLSRDLIQYRPRRKQRYAFVNVLLVTWEEDDIGLTDEVERLADIFKTEFNYQVWPYKIPSYRSQEEFGGQIGKIVQLFSHDDSLIIMYYGGHGGKGKDKECIWSAYVKLCPVSL